jgi:hypothetical protein
MTRSWTDFESHPTCGRVVYMDRDQCARFGTDYHDAEARCAIAASTLLASREYDDAHHDVLGPLGSATVLLERRPDQMPGWFTITKVVPA